MKILRIIARLNIGGPARNAVLLSEGMQTVLVCGEVGEGEGDMGYLAKKNGVEPVIVEELGRELSFRNDWRAFWKIYSIICRERPDIVHTHTAKAGTLGRMAGVLYNAIGSRLRSNRKILLVHTFHGHVFHSYFGRIKTLFFLWIERILAIFTNRIITVSESLKKELVERFRVAPEKKFSVIELGFELDELLKLPAKDKSDAVNVGIAGRLTAIKNHKMLFRILKKSEIRNPKSETKIKLSIIGDGELRQELEDYAKELSIEDLVEFRGWIKDLKEIYRELDIVVLTSLNEGTPVSIIEAMAAGRAVVATNVGGVSDVIQDGKSGYLTRTNDEENFSERLLDLVGDSNKRKKFGEYGRELVKNRFLKERLILDMNRLYKTLLGKNGDMI
ncbi:glycosyltransferase family 4 protein [Candidatus Omnitrophota bacterium]